LLAGKIIIQRATLTLVNTDNRYSPWNTAGALYANIGTNKAFMTPCRIYVNEEGYSFYLFNGFVKTPKETIGNNRVTFEVWDLGEKLKKQISTTMYVDYLEHEIVVAYLEAAGLVDGTHFISPGNPGATIDYSTTLIEYSWLDDEPVWDELADLAQSTGSRCYVDPLGLVHYEQAWRWVTDDDTPETFTLNNMGDMSPEYNDSDYYDEIVIEYAPRAFGAPGTEIWTQDRKTVIDPGEEKEIIARFQWPAVSVETPVANDSFYLTQVNGADVSGTYPPVFDNYAQQSVITIDNTGTVQIVLTASALKGRPIQGQPTEQSKKSITSPLSPRRLEVRGNPYIQSKIQADHVRDILHWWYSEPKLRFTLKNLRGSGTRDLGTKISITIPMNDGSTTLLYGVVIRNQWSVELLTNGALRFLNTIECIQDVWSDVGSYFIINESLLETDGHILWH